MILRQHLRELSALRDTLLTLGRLEAVALLGEPALARQRLRARAAAGRIDQASWIDEHLAVAHARAPACGSWPPLLRARVQAWCSSDAMNLEAVDQESRAQEALAFQQWREALSTAESSALLEPAAVLLARFGGVIASAGPAATREQAASERGPAQVLTGPAHVALDPVFRRTFSLLREGRDPTLSGLEHDRAPYYWCLSIRESMAAALCALCLIEYDGLPLAYYRDFAKQAWDETRHAQFFLGVGERLLPGFVAEAPSDHPLRELARQHLEMGTGLPVPLEGNLYEAARQGSLIERLVLMHHDEEVTGVGGLVEQARSDFWAARPEQASQFEITVDDETSHVRLGRRWLEHLAPDRATRDSRIEEARSLRGFHILQSLATWNGASISSLLARIGQKPSTAPEHLG